jgi:hypothetical protein
MKQFLYQKIMANYTASEAEKLWQYRPMQTDQDMRFIEVYGSEMVNSQLQGITGSADIQTSTQSFGLMGTSLDLK